MPTPPRRTGSASWKAQPHRLDADTRKELISFLDLDPAVRPKDKKTADKALGEVEKWLGSYPGADDVYRNAPKASDFVRALSSIENDTHQLLLNLKESHKWIHDEFSRSQYDLEQLYGSLDKLAATSRSIKEKYEGTESRGPPKKSALRQLILKLREVFVRFHRKPVLPRREIGFVRPLSEFESQEEDFIKFSLADAEIVCSKEEIRRLLAEPNMTVQSGMRDRIIADTEARWTEIAEIEARLTEDEKRNLLENKKE